jgi:hypothetical protein
MEITCPHCQTRHSAEAEVCPVCGTPVASAPAAGAADHPAPQRATPTAPAQRAGITTPMEHARVTARRPTTGLVAPWRLVLMGVTLPLILTPIGVYAALHLAAHATSGDPRTLPTATSAPAIWPPSGATPVAAPTPTYPITPQGASPTPGGGKPTSTATAVPTATLPPPGVGEAPWGVMG